METQPMAATRGVLLGGRKNSETGAASRLGSEYVTARLSTWETHANVTTFKDGRVVVTVTDDNGMIFEAVVNAEGEQDRSVSLYMPGHTQAEWVRQS